MLMSLRYRKVGMESHNVTLRPEACLSSSEPSNEDKGGLCPAQPQNSKGLYVCYFYTEITLTFVSTGQAVVDDDEVADKQLPKKCMFHYIDMQDTYTQLLT